MSSPRQVLLAMLAVSFVVSTTSRAGTKSSGHDLRPIVSRAFADYHGCFLLRDLKTGQTMAAGTDCTVRLPPCSTFKIVSSLLLLDGGLATPTTPRLGWDGKKRWVRSWNQDHDLESAFFYSVLWFYQRLVPRLGRQSIQRSLADLSYGNRRTGKDLTTFWIDGSLRISPREQLDLMTGLYRGSLPFSKAAQQTVRAFMDKPIEGRTPLGGKTGTCLVDGRTQVGWFVGHRKLAGSDVVHVTLIRADDHATGWQAKRIGNQIIERLERLP